jgi:kynureninase
MMVSFYRPTPGRHKVLIEEAAFPSDAYAVASHVASRGYDPAKAVIVARPRPGEHTMRTDDLEAIFDERGTEIALALLPGVQYYTGQRLELGRIVRTAQVAGAKVGLDLAHGIGNVPLALHDWNVDFAAWCHYKYLNAGPGAVGGCFVHERHADNHKLPRFAGWWGNDPATRFRLHLNEEFVPRTGADGWQISNPQMLSLTPLIAALDQFDRAGLGPLREKSLQLTGYLEYLIDRLPPDRIRIITPRDPEQRGCQLSLLVAQDARALFESVRARGIVADFRQPDVIRLAPVPLYNSFHEVWRVGRAFEELLGG